MFHDFLFSGTEHPADFKDHSGPILRGPHGGWLSQSQVIPQKVQLQPGVAEEGAGSREPGPGLPHPEPVLETQLQRQVQIQTEGGHAGGVHKERLAKLKWTEKVKTR